MYPIALILTNNLPENETTDIPIFNVLEIIPPKIIPHHPEKNTSLLSTSKNKKADKQDNSSQAFFDYVTTDEVSVASISGTSEISKTSELFNRPEISKPPKSIESINPDIFMTITEKDVDQSQERERLISKEIYLWEFEDVGKSWEYIYNDKEWQKNVSIFQKNVMPLHKWYQILCQKNSHFECYQRPYNDSWIIFDKSVLLEALDIHSELDTSGSSTTTPYLALTVHDHPKDNITNNNNNLVYTYEDYENDISLTNCIYKSSQRNFFYGLTNYLNIYGRVSIPALLGLNILEIVIQLRNIINITFPNLFAQVKKHHNAIITTNRIKNKMKRKARSLFSENLENDMPTPTTPSTSSTTVNINSGILVSSNGLPMTPKSTQALVCEYASELNKKKNVKKKLKRIENKLTECKQIENPFIITNLQENKENIEILSQPCSQCFTMLSSKRQYYVHSIGFTFKVSVTCDCGKYMEYSNETSTNFSLAVASSGLVGGINHQSLEMILAMLGITQQYTKNT
ncbi:hypothetical protein RhiirB3_453851, partial [Rhizophagus irregularis]